MSDVVVFENKKDYNNEIYFSVVGIIGILTGNNIPKRYWSDLKRELKDEEDFFQLYEKIVQLKLMSNDSKKYSTDCANLETIFRIIQSIPSPKAEPIKQWLVKVGFERIKEIENPEIAQERMMEIYKQKGYDEKWIKQRIQSIKVRKEGNLRGTVEQDYALFTSIMSKETFGITPSEHKKIKRLERENLRDHFDETELILNMLDEMTAKQIRKTNNTNGKGNLMKDIQKVGKIVENTRREIEKGTEKKVVNGSNYLSNKSKKIKGEI
ncbi:MAG: hypothetical protein LBH46_04005 [Rickettsiales bacterium]|jgi:hypothetical protein|nr:hypothetical protein [Rickettsiales bacterium]